MQHPNILFLMSDEHRADVAGFAGNAVVRTPTLDWLAETGVVFENCYTPSPICIPMRQCMAVGQLPRTCGVEHYGQDLPPQSYTFARHLAEQGYDTVCAGKLHHLGWDQNQGWMLRIGMEGLVGHVCEDRPKLDNGSPGGDGKWSDAKEIKRAGIGEGPHCQLRDRYYLDGLRRFIEERFSDPYYDRSRAERPLLLKQSYNRPHYPYLTDKDLFTYYLNRVTPFDQEQVFDHPFLSGRQVRIGQDVSAREARRATAAYYGMIEEIDRDYGSVLDCLRHHGQDLDDWIIIYTSDHGEMLGQHGVWEKQKFFEASVRVPLIIRCPARFVSRRVHRNVNSCDLFATIADLADLPAPDPARSLDRRGFDSRSLVPLLTEGDQADWNDESISQFGGSNLMIKRGALKYQRYDRKDCADQSEVLFDLAKEPDEQRNLIDHPEYAELVTSFRRRGAALGFGPDADPAYRNAGY
jgi:choline-sulfatase